MDKSVCYVVTQSELGGAQNHVLDLIISVRERFGVFVVVGNEGYFANAVRKLGIEVFVVNNLVVPISPAKDLLCFFDLISLFAKLKPSIIHCHSTKAGIIGRAAAFVLGIKSVFSAHGWSFADGVSVHRKYLGIVSEFLLQIISGKILVPSKKGFALGRKYGIADRKMEILYTGISEIAPVTPNLSVLEKEPIFKMVMVARFSSQKDHATLIRSAVALENIELHLVGDGELLESMIALVAELGIQEKVKFRGKLDGAAKYFSEFSLFVLASHYEGLPISILEALRASLPVLATDVDGVSESIFDGLNGYLIRRNDPKDWSEKILYLQNNPQILQKMAIESRQIFEQRFTLDVMKRNVIDIYQRMIG